MGDRLVGTVEAAKRLGVSRVAIHYRIHAGTLPAQRVGRDWLIKASDLAAQPKARRFKKKI